MRPIENRFFREIAVLSVSDRYFRKPCFASGETRGFSVYWKPPFLRIGISQPRILGKIKSEAPVRRFESATESGFRKLCPETD